MVEVHFDNIQLNIIGYLQRATSTIRIAVSWFTDFEIYDILVNLARKGIRIEIILLDDKINENIKNKFSKLSSVIIHTYWYQEQEDGLMHNKFCVIDNNIVITGSYNWTRNAANKNKENITVIRDLNIAKTFIKEFLFIKDGIEFGGNSFEVLINKMPEIISNEKEVFVNKIHSEKRKCIVTNVLDVCLPDDLLISPLEHDTYLKYAYYDYDLQDEEGEYYYIYQNASNLFLQIETSDDKYCIGLDVFESRGMGLLRFETHSVNALKNISKPIDYIGLEFYDYRKCLIHYKELFIDDDH